MLSDKFFPVTYASSYLWEKLQQAIQEANTLPRAALGIDSHVLTAKIVRNYSYQPLSLDKEYAKRQKQKYIVRILDQSPKELNISWPLTGSTNLLGKLDGNRNFITSKVIDGAISETWAFARALGSDDETLQRIRRSIGHKTAFFEQHFAMLNRSIDAYNQELQNTIPGLVKKRLELLTQLRKAEKFLN